MSRKALTMTNIVQDIGIAYKIYRVLILDCMILLDKSIGISVAILITCNNYLRENRLVDSRD